MWPFGSSIDRAGLDGLLEEFAQAVHGKDKVKQMRILMSLCKARGSSVDLLVTALRSPQVFSGARLAGVRKAEMARRLLVNLAQTKEARALVIRSLASSSAMAQEGSQAGCRPDEVLKLIGGSDATEALTDGKRPPSRG